MGPLIGDGVGRCHKAVDQAQTQGTGQIESLHGGVFPGAEGLNGREKDQDHRAQAQEKSVYEAVAAIAGHEADLFLKNFSAGHVPAIRIISLCLCNHRGCAVCLPGRRDCDGARPHVGQFQKEGPACRRADRCVKGQPDRFFRGIQDLCPLGIMSQEAPHAAQRVDGSLSGRRHRAAAIRQISARSGCLPVIQLPGDPRRAC